MKTALLVPLLLVAGAVICEGHMRKALQQSKSAYTSGTSSRTTTTTTRTSGSSNPLVSIANPLGGFGNQPSNIVVSRPGGGQSTTTTVVESTHGHDDETEMVGPGQSRMKYVTKVKTNASKTQKETCRSVGPKEYCESTEQANCCEDYNESKDFFVACDLASNLYTCASQFDGDKPVPVCCS